MARAEDQWPQRFLSTHLKICLCCGPFGDVVGMTGDEIRFAVSPMCGSCTVLIDGKPRRGHAFTSRSARLIRWQKASRRSKVRRKNSGRGGASEKRGSLGGSPPSAAYCQSGQIMSACALLKANSEAKRFRYRQSDVPENVCRCGTYERIREGHQGGRARKPCLGASSHEDIPSRVSLQTSGRTPCIAFNLSEAKGASPASTPRAQCLWFESTRVAR